MSCHYNIDISASSPLTFGRFFPDRRQGLTLVEILIAVTLMTIIMLAVVSTLTQVSNTLNVSQNAMIISGRAREVQTQIEKDLGNITAPLTPPLRFADGQGYVCIIEGLGSHYGKLYHDSKIGWELGDIAANENGNVDTTIGDCDDIIMFTARAPGDSMFRGLVGGKMAESKYAEICIFLRGTTLYRRVLLIIPDEELQRVLADANYSSGTHPAIAGYGFYRDFDVSARLEWDDTVSDWRVKANTLADLTRRENRFGHAFKDIGGMYQTPFPYGIHNNAAWYQLRLPTLAECTLSAGGSWRLGTQIVSESGLYDRLLSQLTYDGGIDSSWDGNGVGAFPQVQGKPYIDFWNKPLPWNGNSSLTTNSNALDVTTGFYDAVSTSTFVSGQRISEDVLLNNVIGFDIKPWDSTRKEYIDLGQYRNDDILSAPDIAKAREFANDLGSLGFYGLTGAGTIQCYANDGSYQYGLLPAVYDTGTDAYENDATNTVMGTNGTAIVGIASDLAYDGIADIMEHVDEWRCPPPYTVPLTGLQIKIRVFDPGTNNIRDVTIRKSFN